MSLTQAAEWATIVGTCVSVLIAIIALIVTIRTGENRDHIEELSKQTKHLARMVEELSMTHLEKLRRQNKIEAESINEIKKSMDKIIEKDNPSRHMESFTECQEYLKNLITILQSTKNSYLMKIDNRIDLLWKQSLDRANVMLELSERLFPANPNPVFRSEEWETKRSLDQSLSMEFAEITLAFGRISSYINERIIADKKVGDVYDYVDVTVPGYYNPSQIS